jgi:hypothetical protein
MLSLISVWVVDSLDSIGQEQPGGDGAALEQSLHARTWRDTLVLASPVLWGGRPALAR